VLCKGWQSLVQRERSGLSFAKTGSATHEILSELPKGVLLAKIGSGVHGVVQELPMGVCRRDFFRGFGGAILVVATK